MLDGKEGNSNKFPIRTSNRPKSRKKNAHLIVHSNFFSRRTSFFSPIHLFPFPFVLLHIPYICLARPQFPSSTGDFSFSSAKFSTFIFSASVRAIYLHYTSTSSFTCRHIDEGNTAKVDQSIV